SISVNPTVANIDINNATTDWLWAAFAVMFLSDLVFIYWSYTKPIGMRTFYQLPVLILSTASIAYFSMASDLGATPIVAEFPRGAAAGSTRSIWYVRYIDWTITTPLLLLELLLATGLPLSEILIIIFMDLVMIVAGLVGALVQSRYKWGYYAFGCGAQFFIWWGTLVKAPQATTAMGNDVRRSYTASAYALALIWLLYPIAWAVADGGNVISPLKEMIFYGILDLVAKPVFCFYHAYQISKVPYERFLLSSGK
ncbi:heat shock protein 30, partial [Stereum hirsutum FP-91666 SS1]|uniref:heat shock protein 30 n=1 Tax=Stereum hirsutum (strain FP-91666) TaxID=721885 RepID=UPI000440F7EE